MLRRDRLHRPAVEKAFRRLIRRERSLMRGGRKLGHARELLPSFHEKHLPDLVVPRRGHPRTLCRLGRSGSSPADTSGSRATSARESDLTWFLSEIATLPIDARVAEV